VTASPAAPASVQPMSTSRAEIASLRWLPSGEDDAQPSLQVIKSHRYLERGDRLVDCEHPLQRLVLTRALLGVRGERRELRVLRRRARVGLADRSRRATRENARSAVVGGCSSEWGRRCLLILQMSVVPRTLVRRIDESEARRVKLRVFRYGCEVISTMR
jgi:hypothetical protein